MSQIHHKNLSNPDETRPFVDGKGHLDIVDVDGFPVGLATFEPGWRWSDHVGPLAGTTSCQVAHFGYIVSGSLTVRMDDGEQASFRAGDVVKIEPGHDAWVASSVPCIMIDWTGVGDYAKPELGNLDLREPTTEPAQ